MTLLHGDFLHEAGQQHWNSSSYKPMTTLTVAFLRKGYVAEMSLDEYNKLSEDELKDTMVLYVMGINVYETN